MTNNSSHHGISADRTTPTDEKVNPLTPELNPSKQRCLPELFTGAFKF